MFSGITYKDSLIIGSFNKMHNNVYDSTLMIIAVLVVSLCCLCYDISSNLNYLLATVIVICILTSKIDTFVMLFVFLMIWYVALEHSNAHQLVQYAFTVKLMLFLFHDKIKDIKLEDILILAYLFIYAVFSLVLTHYSGAFWIAINSCMIILIFRARYKEYSDEKKSTLFAVYIFSVLIALLWGIVHGIYDNGRFSGVYEPNFMSFYINISIALLFFVNWIRIFKVIILLVLYIALFATESLGGIITNVTIILILLLLSLKGIRHKKMQTLVFIFFIAITTVLIVGNLRLIERAPEFYSVFQRIIDSYNNILIGDYSHATTRRTDLWAYYLSIFQIIPLYNQIFGTFSLRPQDSIWTMEALNYSHNSYIDILFGFGIIGLIILSIYNLSTIKNYIISNDKVILAVKLAVLVQMFSLSGFSSKPFLFWFFI